MTADVSWMFETIMLRSSEEYKTVPFAWAGTLNTVRWKGDETQRQTALLNTAAAFANNPWLVNSTWNTEPWPEAAKTAYVRLLKSFYTFDAVRILACAYGVDSDGEITDLATRLVDARIPLASPDYLAAFANRVKKISTRNSEGSVIFIMNEADRYVPQAARGPAQPAETPIVLDEEPGPDAVLPTPALPPFLAGTVSGAINMTLFN
jgi:hypothetical protein